MTNQERPAGRPARYRMEAQGRLRLDYARFSDVEEYLLRRNGHGPHYVATYFIDPSGEQPRLVVDWQEPYGYLVSFDEDYDGNPLVVADEWPCEETLEIVRDQGPLKEPVTIEFPRSVFTSLDTALGAVRAFFQTPKPCSALVWVRIWDKCPETGARVFAPKLARSS